MKMFLLEKFYSLNALLTGKIELAKIGERSEQKANFILSLFNSLLCVGCHLLPW
jgi:hypothetical protein